MRQELIIHGVPDSLKRDAWWLSMSETTSAQTTPRAQSDKSLFSSLGMGHKIPLLGVLVTLADWLFWHQPIGISLAVFAMILSAAIVALKTPRTNRRERVGAMGFALVCNLPLCIDLQFLSVLFSLAGLVLLVGWSVYGLPLNERLFFRVAIRLPTIGNLLLSWAALRDLPEADMGKGIRRQASSAVLPFMMGIIFLMLLAAANPVLEGYLQGLDPTHLFTADFWLRVLFWCLIGSQVWACLNLSKSWLGSGAQKPSFQRAGPGRVTFLINPLSVRNSLFLFNLLFLVQTGMDIGIFTGGVALPDGMTYASYAHRGAYPLVVTALLAGVFVLLTRSMIAQDRVLRNLVYLWLAQNIFLVMTAAFRLMLYVEAYALTYLRVAAFIWMGLVLIGLVLTVIQVHRGLGVDWLLRRCLATVVVTVYVCCFVNFAHLIAGYNLTHGQDLALRDTYYICGLGPDAYPAIHAFEAKTGERICGKRLDYLMSQDAISNWREWGFRRWRIQAYYQAQS